MNILYLICFILGIVLSLLAAFAGAGHVHAGHLHAGHLHAGHLHAGHLHAGQANPSHAPGGHLPAVNGFTLAAFLCWFGGAGYLLDNYSAVILPIVLLLAILAGLVASSLIYALIFKFLLPRERVLSAEDTRMDGVVARLSDGIRTPESVGEILFSQDGTRRSAAARSESGLPIPRGTEVVVLRYSRGIAWVSPIDEHLPPGPPASETFLPTHKLQS